MSLDKIKIGREVYTIMPRVVKGITYARVSYTNRSGKRRDICGVDRNAADRKKFIARVKKKILEINSGVETLIQLPDPQKQVLLAIHEQCPSMAQLEEFLAWRESKSRSISLGSLRDLYLQDKEENVQVSHSYFQDLRKLFNRFVLEFGENTSLIELNYVRLSQYIEENWGDKSARTRNNIIRFLSSLFKWAQKKRFYPVGEIPTDRFTLANSKGGSSKMEAFTPDEGRILLEEATEEFLPWLVLCGWNGLRTEEVCPKAADKKKRPIMWEDISWEKDIIIVHPDTNKNAVKRVIPLHPITRKYLEPLRKDRGKIGGKHPSEGKHSETKRLGKIIGRWKQNGLRNSYISYRAALVGVGQTAMESGNSEAICKKNYLDATTKELAEEWFLL